MQKKGEELKGKITKEVVIPAKGELGLIIRKGQILRVIDVEGKQVMDLVCFNLQRPEEKLWIANTIKLNGTIYLKKGHALYSDYAQKMFTIIEDTAGIHDVLYAACSAEVNYVRYGISWHPNCTDNLIKALCQYGIRRKDIPMTFNLFMNAPVKKNGSLTIEEPVSKPGDFMDLQAEMDMIVGISNCPQDLNCCNGWNPTPLKIIIYEKK